MNDLSPQILSTRPARGLANWRGLWTLYHKEVRRFLKIFGQTLLAPVVTTLLFLTVFAVAFGGGRMVAGMPYVQFLTPGLIMMAILQNAFTNTSTSLIQMKLNENIVDTLMPPLSPFELATAFIFSGATRGVMVALGVGVALSIVEPFDIHSAGLILFYGLGAAVMMSTIGLITGIWAEKFDHISTVNPASLRPISAAMCNGVLPNSSLALGSAFTWAARIHTTPHNCRYLGRLGGWEKGHRHQLLHFFTIFKLIDLSCLRPFCLFRGNISFWCV